MSSILKALKKVENEHKHRVPANLRIDTDILRPGDSPRFSIVTVSLAAAFLFICGSTVTYLYLKGAGTSGPSRQSAPPASDSATPQALPAVPPAPQQIGTDDKAAALRREQQKPSAAPPRSPGKAPSEKRHGIPAGTAQAGASSQTVPSSTVTPAETGIAPGVRVNGIAFQAGGIDSLAVVNGVSVSNGSIIGGARVEEIQKDRVRFVYAGKRFEVMLGESNR